MVEIIARVPDDHHPWQSVFLAADRDEYGPWRADGPRFEWRHGSHHLFLDLPDGTPLKFLITRGHWRNAEVAADGREHLPRELVARKGLRYEVSVARWGRNQVHYHHDFASQFLPHARTVTVWLPPGYDHDPHRRYPVLYLHDGQNLFDAHTAFAGVPWRCDESAEQLARTGEITPLIQVGVYNTPDRLKEYGPTGRADDLATGYARFLTEELKPFIDAEYRTRTGPEFTGVCGSSMGGLISLELARRHSDVFGRCAALSPSLWWDGERLLHELGDRPEQLAHCRVWVDMGTREGPSSDGLPPMVRRARRLAFHLRHTEPHQFRYTEADGGMHNEWAWAARYPDVLRFLFPR